MNKKNVYYVEDFIGTLLHRHNVSLVDIYYYAQESRNNTNDININNIIDIFKLSTKRQRELCLTLLEMISIKNNRSIVMEFRKENKLLASNFDLYISEEAIEKNKVLLVSALMYNTEFCNSALLLCAYMGRMVLDKAAEYINVVKQDGFKIESVPIEYKIDIPTITLTAVNQSGQVLNIISNKTFEVCLTAVRKYPWALEYITDILDDFQNEQIYEICKAAVTRKGLTLQFVFPELKNKYNFSDEHSKYLCMEAVKNNGLALDHVPIKLRDNEQLCLEAVKQNSRALDSIAYDRPWVNAVEEAARLQEEKEVDDIVKGRIKPLVIGEEVEYIENDKKKIIEYIEYPNYKNSELSGKYMVIGKVSEKNYPVVIRENFAKNAGLKKLYIPKFVKEIESGAFLGNDIFELYFEHIPVIKGNIITSGFYESIPEEFKNKDPEPNKLYHVLMPDLKWDMIDKALAS